MPGFFRQETGNGRGVAGVLLVPERDDAHACGLCQAAEIGNRDAGHAIDRPEAVEREGIDDEVKAVRQLSLGIGGFGISGCGRSF
jgi:hypothetical protein